MKCAFTTSFGVQVGGQVRERCEMIKVNLAQVDHRNPITALFDMFIFDAFYGVETFQFSSNEFFKNPISPSMDDAEFVETENNGLV